MRECFRLYWAADRDGNAGSLLVAPGPALEKLAAALRSKHGYQGVYAQAVVIGEKGGETPAGAAA